MGPGLDASAPVEPAEPWVDESGLAGAWPLDGGAGVTGLAETGGLTVDVFVCGTDVP